MTPGKDVKVLVVDDNALILDLLMKGLMPHCDAQAAADGADALLKIVDDPPDLVVCDYRMPGLDGRQLYEKLRGRQQKYILTKLAERVGVPKEALYRRKQGFALPLVHWIRNELKDLLMTVLLEPRTVQRGYFNPEGVRRLLEEHFSGRRVHSQRIWRLLMFEMWHRNFLENFQSANWRGQLEHATLMRGAIG